MSLSVKPHGELMMHEIQCIRHLIDSADWTIEDINDLWELTRRLRSGEAIQEIGRWLEKKTVILSFNKESTRSRLTWQRAIVEMGGVPIETRKDDLHAPSIENIVDFAVAMAFSSSAICIRLLPDDEYYSYGQCENVLRRIAEVAEAKNQVPVISMSHDRCHPCQGLYEALTIQDALERENLAGTRILVTWVKGDEPRPWSPTQDSLMLFTRLGMKVTLCNPPGYEIDPNVIRQCKNNSKSSGGMFKKTNDFEKAFLNQEIVYARHWGSNGKRTSRKYDNWYLNEERFGRAKSGAFFIHPMPLKRNDEVDEKVADSDKSLLKHLVVNKYFLQKAVLAMATGFNPNM